MLKTQICVTRPQCVKKLIYLQLVKKFSILYENMSFVIVFETARHLSWYWRRYRVQDSRHLSRSSCFYRVQDNTPFVPILISLSCSRKLAFCPDFDIVIVFKKARLLSQFWRRAKGTLKRSKNCRIFRTILSFFFGKDFITARSTHKQEEHLPSAVPQTLIHYIRSSPSYLEAYFAIH